MKIKNVNLVWNVFREDISARKIKPYNVLGYSFAEELAKAIKKNKIENREQLKKYLKQDFMYHYWSKAECEIVIGSPNDKYENYEKIDIWRQIEINFDNIIDYIIKEMQLFKKKGDKNEDV